MDVSIVGDLKRGKGHIQEFLITIKMTILITLETNRSAESLVDMTSTPVSNVIIWKFSALHLFLEPTVCFT